MNDKFNELAKGLAQTATCSILCLTLAAQTSVSVGADDTLGPIINLSDPDVFANCPVFTPPPSEVGAQKEASIAVNPINPHNIVAAWIPQADEGAPTAVSLDGGATWQTTFIPALTSCSGNPAFPVGGGADPWLSFAPNGDLYQIRNHYLDDFQKATILSWAVSVSKSTDGGLHWSNPLDLFETTDRRFAPDKWSITADWTDSRFVYAIWDNSANGNRGQAILSRTTDGGRTWEPARAIYSPSGGNDATLGHIISVLPDGTLVDIFSEFRYSDGGAHAGALLSVVRSGDKGLSWSSPVRAAAMPVFSVVDAETGALIVNSSSCCPNPASASDRRNGNCYAAWEDTRFNSGGYSSIAFSASSDGGITWSEPIRINQTPTNVAPSNQQAFIPAIAVASDGSIAVTYYDFRFNDPGPGLLTDYWLVRCHPSSHSPPTDPASWNSEVRLTDSSFDIETAYRRGGGLFIGDYEGLAAVGTDFIAVWTQPHGGDPDSIFLRRVAP